MNIKTLKSERLWRAEKNDKLESVSFAFDIKKGKLLTRIESKNEYPNYYIRDIRKKDKKEPITFFENPFASLKDVHKEVITYKRDDGVDLSATLYLPADYDKKVAKSYP
jgi:dipeptidyl aminopeptidase/acylaminoacyl peptidase